MQEPITDIVIVNWNAGAYLDRCVRSVLNTTNLSQLGKIIVIDNASSDDSLAKLPVSDKICLIVNAENRGFSVACNQGFKESTASYVLLLNPDAAVFPDTLAKCFTYLTEHADTDILGCRLVNEEGKTTISCARFPTPWRYLTDAIGLSKMMPKLFHPATLMTDWNHEESCEVDQVMGAFMLIKKETLQKTGYFDERFFVYYEELDFSKRVKEIGGVVYFNAQITALHSGGGTTRAVKAFRLYLSLNSRLLYAQKHFSVAGYAITWLATFLIEPFSRLIQCVLKGNFSGIGNIAAGYWRLIK